MPRLIAPWLGISQHCGNSKITSNSGREGSIAMNDDDCGITINVVVVRSKFVSTYEEKIYLFQESALREKYLNAIRYFGLLLRRLVNCIDRRYCLSFIRGVINC